MRQPERDGLLRRQDLGGHIRPFDQADAILQHLIDAEFVQFRNIRKPVEIEMGDWNAGGIGLDDREGGAWNFQIRFVRHCPDEGAGKRRFAGAEIADQGQTIAGFQSQRKVFTEPDGVLFSRKGNGDRQDVFAHSAAMECGRVPEGMRQVTMVPLPGRLSMLTVP